MASFLRDIRYVTRSLLRTPAFFAVTVVTLALGIGATTSIYSVIEGVLLRPLPYPEPGRIVQLWQVGEKGGQGQFSDPNFDDVRTQSRSFVSLAEFTSSSVVSVTGTPEPVRVRGSEVTSDFFAVLGVRPIRGRLFDPDELKEGGIPAVVISEGFWRRYLGASPAFARTSLTFEGRSFAIVGVMPDILNVPTGTDLWVPRELSPRNPYRTGHNFLVLGRLRDGVTLAAAQQEVSALARRLKREYGDQTWMFDAALVPLQEQIVGKARPTLLVLLAASGFLLLIACANVVNLLVARLTARQDEIALRLALGAGRARLAQQFLAESLVLALGGGALGVLMAFVGVPALLALEPGNLPRVTDVHLSLPVLTFALGTSGLAATVIGLLIAWRGTRGDLREAMAQSQRTHSGVRASDRIRSVLVVAQVALTLMLLVGVGLLGRSFLRLLEIKPGYRTERALVMDLSIPTTDDSSGIRRRAREYEAIVARLATVPGVSDVGGVNAFPLSGGNTSDGTFLILSRPDEPLDMSQLPRLIRDPARSGEAEYRVATGSYFRAMNIPLVRGRLFDDRDVPDGQHVALISESLARLKWPNQDPIGKFIQYGNMDGDLRPFMIVGIVGDVREASLATPARPTFYANAHQRTRQLYGYNIVMRVSGAVEPVIAAARQLMRELQPSVPPRFRTIEAVVSSSVADRRFVLILIGVFGAAALVLATLGVYSVVSYLVTLREREIGIRVALGAQRDDVLRLVLRQGAILVVIGIAAGAVGAAMLTRLITDFLFGVGAFDPMAFASVTLVLATIAMIASWVPARRATRVDPMHVLRGT
jgi:predicted permease